MHHIFPIALNLLRNCQGIVEVIQTDKIFEVDTFKLIALHSCTLINRAHFIEQILYVG
jgi:hypothetical protein